MPQAGASDRLSQTVDLLTGANSVLAGRFELAEVLPKLAHLCVPMLADYCVIEVRGDKEHEVASAAVAASKDVDVTRVGDGSSGDQLMTRLRECGLHSMIVTPISLEGDQFGVLLLASAQENAFDELHHKIAALLALRVAEALHVTRRVSREHRVADRLQRALLPESFPDVPGIAFSGSYQPASDEAEVGGDWYDAVALPDGRVAVSIGDVAGHGLEAAVIMGEVRQALRAAAIVSQTPSEVLDAVNGVINLRENIGMVTAVFGFYDPAVATLHYAVAGHPPPIIATPDGFADVLPGGGLPLGAGPSCEARNWTFTLPPGGQLVFYTDGLIEYDRDLEMGQRTLLEAVVTELHRENENPAQAIHARIFAQAKNKDDSATLTLTRSAEGATDQTLRFSAVPLVSALVRSVLRPITTQLSLSADDAFSILVACGEAIANAVEHAYGDRDPGLLDVNFTKHAKQFVVEINDYGRWRPFQKREERGRGIPLMHALVDGVQIKTSQTSTKITLSLDLEKVAS